MQDLIQKRRYRRLHKLNAIIARATVMIDGTDEEMWPEYVAYAQLDRQRAARERVELLNKISKG